MQGTEYPPPRSLKKELVATVREVIGPIATPDVIHWAPGKPLSASVTPAHDHVDFLGSMLAEHVTCWLRPCLIKGTSSRDD